MSNPSARRCVHRRGRAFEVRATRALPFSDERSDNVLPNIVRIHFLLKEDASEDAKLMAYLAIVELCGALADVHDAIADLGIALTEEEARRAGLATQATIIDRNAQTTALQA